FNRNLPTSLTQPFHITQFPRPGGPYIYTPPGGGMPTLSMPQRPPAPPPASPYVYPPPSGGMLPPPRMLPPPGTPQPPNTGQVPPPGSPYMYPHPSGGMLSPPGTPQPPHTGQVPPPGSPYMYPHPSGGMLSPPGTPQPPHTGQVPLPDSLYMFPHPSARMLPPFRMLTPPRMPPPGTAPVSPWTPRAEDDMLTPIPAGLSARIDPDGSIRRFADQMREQLARQGGNSNWALQILVGTDVSSVEMPSDIPRETVQWLIRIRNAWRT
ncbi:hypothetical protein F5X98DRAFT_387902, partial [Xylaria grammica]